MDIVSWTFENVNANENKPLYIDIASPSRSLSAGQTWTLVRQLVAGFKNHGLEKGDCVCVVSFNDIHYTSTFLGIIGAGGCFSGANPGYTAHELSYHLRMTGARFLLASPKTLDKAIMAANACEIPPSRIFVLNFEGEEIPEAHQSWTKLLSCGERDWVEVDDPDNTPAAYASTSGTSGLPKAAVIPHSYLVDQGRYQDQIAATDYKISNLIAIPPFHAFTIPIQHALPLRNGTPTYIMPRYEEQAFLNALEKFQITHTIVVPPILVALSKNSETKKLGSLRRVYVGGSLATDSMQQQLYAKLPPEAKIEQVYGMTEAGWATIWHDRTKESTGSVGRPLPGTNLRLVDKDGHIIEEEGANGEIQIKAPHPMTGYLHNADATAEAFTEDGWLRSGDIGYVRHGKWYVIDRTKDLIKVRGWQVSPAEIEATILELPDVVDAAVIGVAVTDGSGEVPVAYVVKNESSHLTEEDTKNFLRFKLARYKEVNEVNFVQKIPRNPTGKILRRVLRDRRRTQPVLPSEGAASVYSNAIKELERYVKDRNSARSSEDTRSKRSPEPICPNLSRSYPASLSDASTIEEPGPVTPPSTDEVSAMSVNGRKRKDDSVSPSQVKRRTANIGWPRTLQDSRV